MTELTPVPTPLEVAAVPETREQKARRLIDEAALRIGRDTVNHLKTMYPAALSAVTKNAELANFVRNRVNSLMRPVVARMMALMDAIEGRPNDADQR